METKNNENINQKTFRLIIMKWITIVTIFIFLLLEMENLENKIERQSHRSDKLYEMFIDLLKERKQG